MLNQGELNHRAEVQMMNMMCARVAPGYTDKSLPGGLFHQSSSVDVIIFVWCMLT